MKNRIFESIILAASEFFWCLCLLQRGKCEFEEKWNLGK